MNFYIGESKHGIQKNAIFWGDFPNGVLLFYFTKVGNPPCCALQEFAGWGMPDYRTPYSDDLQKVFNEFMFHPRFEGTQLVEESYRNPELFRIPTFRIMVTNSWDFNSHAPEQPPWLISCLDNYPKVIKTGWHFNSNMKSRTKVNTYLLPRPGY